MAKTRDALSVEQGAARKGLQVRRYFTSRGTHPYDELTWDRRDAVITNWRDGTTAFEQRGLEFPSTWSQNATNIVAQKYFRGPLGTPQRESSVRQMVDRVAGTITRWGVKDGYFASDADAEAFQAELTHILVNQKAAFNSPVWFNVGVEPDPQSSACFILSVDDTMPSILNWYVEEGMIFKGGSGSGVNLSTIRSSREPLGNGGEASGPVSFMRGADASAGTIKCLHRDTEIVTDAGVVAVAQVEPGSRVLTRHGFRRVEAVHDNGTRPLVRVRTALGDEILCTPEHRFRVRGADGETWRQAGHLQADDYVMIDLAATQHGTLQRLTPVGPGHHNEIAHELPVALDEAFALWLGWVYGDGSITTHTSAKFIAMQLGDGDPELVARYTALTRTIFGEQAHIFTNRHHDKADASASVRFCSSQVIRFLEANGLRKGKTTQLRVPELVKSSPATVRAAFLAGVFEADGHVGNGYPIVSTISAEFARDLHRLLLSVGIPSQVGIINDRAAAYGRNPVHTVRVAGGLGVRRFAKLVGFLSERKSRLLEAAVERKARSPYELGWVLPHVGDELDVIWQGSTPALKRALAPYARYAGRRSVSLVRARALLEVYPDELAASSLSRFALGEELYVRVTVEPAGEGPTFDLTVEDVHEYLVHNVVTHNSGGKTRRAAKMVILNVDHPDVRDFIWCKAREEHKARALRDAGFDMDLDGRDSISIQYQNANNSVRVTDDFMRAYEADTSFDLHAVLDGRTIETVRARDLMRDIAQAAWECADPGMQYDTTINDWHTTPESGRINASNPCCFIGDTLVDTDEGLVRMELLAKRSDAGDVLPAARSLDPDTGRFVSRVITRAWVAGETRTLVEVRTSSGLAFRSTPEHRFLTTGAGWVEAQELAPGTGLLAHHDQRGQTTDRVVAVTGVALDHPVQVYDLEVDGTHNFLVSDGSVAAGVVVHNSEYMHLDNSACNLASLNLMKFLRDDDVFDVESCRHAIDIVFLAQEIIVGNSSYPTERIAKNAVDYRQLGIGYANLGALLMTQGLPYDSDAGRAWSGAITALLTGQSYRTSARVAQVVGPFAGYAKNREPMLGVIAKHRRAVDGIDAALVQPDLLEAARQSWDDALRLGKEFGFRNAQASVLAPTGTISFLMDCDTTGIEPDLALVKTKKLVGGGSMSIVNQTVPRALRKLGYAEEHVQAIVEYIAQNNSVKGAPALREEHYPVFDCAMGDSPIHYMGHIRMMAAAQPFISGAISKCVTGETLIPTADGLLRIGSLHQGEPNDTFRDEIIEVASLDGTQKTDAFYYGGVRPVREAILRSGHKLTGTPNHRLLVVTAHGPEWRFLSEISVGDYVAQQYGADLWSTLPARFDDFSPSPRYGSQKHVRIPGEMTEELAFLLGAFAAEGHIYRPTYTVVITNSVESVLDRVAAAWRTELGVEARIVRDPGKCPSVAVSSKTIVEFLDYLGCGGRAADKRIPDAVLRSPKPMVLGFLQGLALDAYVTTSAMAKWAICLDAPKLLDDLQAVLTNLGVVHGRISKYNAKYDKSYDEVYASGEQAQRLVTLVPFCEPDKAARAARLADRTFAQSAMDVVPGISGPELYHSIPKGKSGRNGWSLRRNLSFLLDPRTGQVSRRTLERVAALPGVQLSDWAEMVLRDNLRFSPVASVANVGEREVFDLSVPSNHAFVGNGIVNHNTANLPESATVEDVERVYVEGWKLGLKALAIYRDNCKVGQPLSADRKVTTDSGAVIEVDHAPIRRRLPKSRPSKTTSFRVGDIEGYLTAGCYPDDGLGEIFVKVSKQGSTLSGVMDAFAIAVSVGLQYGVPLEALVAKFTNMIFEPNGMTDDPDIRIAQSLVDYLARRLAIDYLDPETRHALGIRTTAERTAALNGTDATPPAASPAPAQAPTQGAAEEPATKPAPKPAAPPPVASELAFTPGMAAVDAPFCSTCGVRMRPAGSCFVCESCGTTSGCS